MSENGSQAMYPQMQNNTFHQQMLTDGDQIQTFAQTTSQLYRFCIQSNLLLDWNDLKDDQPLTMTKDT